jgi:dihydroorotate dehydrogenase
MDTYVNPFNPPDDDLQPEDRIQRSRAELRAAEDDPALLSRLTGGMDRVDDPRLHTTVAGITLENPLIAAAGWDKFGDAVKGLHLLGFAAVEVGTVSAEPQDGNPQPRHFLPGPGVMLNRYGFNTPGMDVIADKLERYRGGDTPMGISLGKNKHVPDDQAPEAYARVARRMLPYAAWFAINVSSPNTPGLRGLQDKGPLTEIVKAVRAVSDTVPVFVKIAPDMTLSAVDDVIHVVVDADLAGIIAVNTTSNGDIKAAYGEHWREEMGGLSGDNAEYRRMATEMIRHIRTQAGPKMAIMGAGGVKDTDTAIEKLRAGANCLQVMTAIQTVGPRLPALINRGLLDYMEENGVTNISELVGA